MAHGALRGCRTVISMGSQKPDEVFRKATAKGNYLTLLVDDGGQRTPTQQGIRWKNRPVGGKRVAKLAFEPAVWLFEIQIAFFTPPP